jgi:UDP-glucose 4-epimerase
VGGKRLNIIEAPRRPGDPPYLVARATRIRAELGWTPKYDDLTAIVKSALAFERKLLKDPWD